MVVVGVGVAVAVAVVVGVGVGVGVVVVVVVVVGRATEGDPAMSDGTLLIEADAILSLIRHRESVGLSETTIRYLDYDLLPRLRRRTDQIITERRADAVGSVQGSEDPK